MALNADYYVILGVNRNASQEEIKKAYLTAAQRLHPDKNKAFGETEIFLEVQQAYETLSNPKRRAAYDATLSPEEKQALPVEFQVHYSRPNLVRMDEPQMLYILLEFRPLTSETMPAPPLNVCLALDRSTSMRGDKMDMLKASAIQVMRGLRQQDLLSVVTFSDKAEVILPSSYTAGSTKHEAQIRTLQPSGSTEMFQGLEAAYNQIKQNLDAKRVNHIILVTDGHTYGDEEKCLALSEQAAQKGIGISAMGIGKEWNDTFLDNLASKTGGNSKYITRPDDIQRYLKEKFDTLSRVLVDDIILDFKDTSGAELAYAFRTQPETGPLPIESPIHFGSVLRDSATHILFEYRILPTAIKRDTLSLMTGVFKLAIAAMPTQFQPVSIKFSREIMETPGAAPPSGLIIQSLGKLTLYRMQEKAYTEVEAGQYELAAHHMKQLATNLLAQGERSLARTALMESENILRMQAFSEEGHKEIKYGTRSLLMAQPKDTPA
jgi:Ca-activated chloride channel family protein